MANETNNREIENNESKSAQTDKTKKIKLNMNNHSTREI